MSQSTLCRRIKEVEVHTYLHSLLTSELDGSDSLGVSSPLCILELSRPMRIDVTVKETTIFRNTQGVSLHTNVSATTKQCRNPEPPSGPSRTYQ